MIRSHFVTTLGALPQWPVVERIAHEWGAEPTYDALVSRQRRTSATIQITLSGSGEADGVLVGPGSAVVLDGVAHPGLRYRAIGRWEFIYVNLQGAGELVRSLVAARGHVVPFPHRHPLIRRWLAQLPRVGDAHLTLTFSESHRLAMEVLGLLCATPLPDGGLAARALAVMADGWDRNLGLADIAKQIKVSPEHLSRVFHLATGETVAAWYRRHRLERARELLRQTTLSVKEVAAQCGFSDSAYFIATFKAAVGTTPARWRRE